MFNKNIEIIIVTRFINEDDKKIIKLANTWKNPGSCIKTNKVSNEIVEVSFELTKSMINKFKKDLNLLTFVGIEAQMK